MRPPATATWHCEALRGTCSLAAFVIAPDPPAAQVVQGPEPAAGCVERRHAAAAVPAVARPVRRREAAAERHGRRPCCHVPHRATGSFVRRFHRRPSCYLWPLLRLCAAAALRGLHHVAVPAGRRRRHRVAADVRGGDQAGCATGGGCRCAQDRGECGRQGCCGVQAEQHAGGGGRGRHVRLQCRHRRAHPDADRHRKPAGLLCGACVRAAAAARRAGAWLTRAARHRASSASALACCAWGRS